MGEVILGLEWGVEVLGVLVEGVLLGLGVVVLGVLSDPLQVCTDFSPLFGSVLHVEDNSRGVQLPQVVSEHDSPNATPPLHW